MLGCPLACRGPGRRGGLLQTGLRSRYGDRVKNLREIALYAGVLGALIAWALLFPPWP
jgi:hypothetical protein